MIYVKYFLDTWPQITYCSSVTRRSIDTRFMTRVEETCGTKIKRVSSTRVIKRVSSARVCENKNMKIFKDRF